MNPYSKILVISALCLFTPLLSSFADPVPVGTIPSTNYVPVATEFSPRFSEVIAKINSLVEAKDKEQLKIVANELLINEEANTGRGDEDGSYFLSAYAKRHAGDLTGAVEDFKKSIEYRQNNQNAHFLLAQTYADLNQCEQVFSELDQVKFSLGYDTQPSYFLRSQCLLKLNRQPEAEVIIAAARKAFPADTQIKKLSLSLKAKALSEGAILSDAQNTELESDLAELAAANPEDSNIQLMYAKSLLKKGDILTKSTELDQGEKIARAQVEKFNFSNESSVKILFDILLKKRMNKEAQEILDKGKEKLPDSKVLADCQKQLSIEIEGLRVLKYDRR